MRISDWSSDVCSSDLPCGGGAIDHAVVVAQRQRQHQPRRKLLAVPQRLGLRFGDTKNRHFRGVDDRGECGAANAAARARKSVVSGKRVSERVELGGCRVINKTKITSKPTDKNKY